MKPILAALVVLMGMGGVALAAPKADQGSPEQAQGNGPAPQAQDPAPPPQAQANGPAPQAQNPAPPPQAKVKGQQGAAKPVAAPPPQPPQPGGGSNPGQSRRSGAGHGRPVPGELRGLGLGRSNRGNCQSAACRGGAPKPSAAASGDQPQPAAAPQGPAAGDAPDGSGERRATHDAGRPPAEDPTGAPESGSVLGANQGGGDEVEAASGSFDGALPFTGFEVVLLAGIGGLLGLAGARLRRSAA